MISQMEENSFDGTEGRYWGSDHLTNR
jgi:hypothetical protein